MGNGQGSGVAVAPFVLSATQLTKTYGGTTVLDAVDLALRPGEIRALLGENGAGKSTFIKIISGAVQATAGTVEINGQKLQHATPQGALAAGIATVHQELAIAPGLSVAENVFLGRKIASQFGIVRWRRLRAAANAIFEELGFPIDVTQEAGSATRIEQAMTSLARAVAVGAPALILDEPTATLTDSEVSQLFRVLRRLQDRGVGVLYVSHRLEEVIELADTYTILRDGVKVDEGLVADIEVDHLITAMAGRRIENVFPERSMPAQDLIVEVNDLASKGLSHATFGLRRGEILGVAGLAGSGRSELLRSLAGVQRITGGTIEYSGQPFRPDSPAAAQDRGVVLVPEERRADALLPDSVGRNLNATTISMHVTGPGIASPSKERAHAQEQWGRFGIRGQGLSQEVLRLSGGNQQKVVLARFLALDPRVVLLDEPTRGVDVATKAEIYRLIAARAAEGTSFVVVSSELPELLGLCHRIAVMRAGALSTSFDATSVTEEQLLFACYGRNAA